MITDAWGKSSRSGGGGDCVECRTPDGGETIQVRDSKDPDGAVLTFPRAGWLAFLRDVNAGRVEE